MRLGVQSVGIFGPGWPDWATAQRQLAEHIPFDLSAPLPKLMPALLPANERRRTTSLIRLALQAALDAIQNAPNTPSEFSTVFATSGGDLAVVDSILRALQTPGKPVSPTQFHNSVHNAPAGYWSIATGSHSPSTSISAFDGSFAAGLLDAATQLAADQQHVLLVAYDEPPPQPLYDCRPLAGPFGVALLLGKPNSDRTNIDVALVGSEDETHLADRALEQLRRNNPAARSLPLMSYLARHERGTTIVPYLVDRAVRIEVMPC